MGVIKKLVIRFWSAWDLTIMAMPTAREANKKLLSRPASRNQVQGQHHPEQKSQGHMLSHGKAEGDEVEQGGSVSGCRQNPFAALFLMPCLYVPASGKKF